MQCVLYSFPPDTSFADAPCCATAAGIFGGVGDGSQAWQRRGRRHRPRDTVTTLLRSMMVLRLHPTLTSVECYAHGRRREHLHIPPAHALGRPSVRVSCQVERTAHNLSKTFHALLEEGNITLQGMHGTVLSIRLSALSHACMGI
jgi:hypothetical protein